MVSTMSSSPRRIRMRLGHLSNLWGPSSASFLPSCTILPLSVGERRMCSCATRLTLPYSLLRAALAVQGLFVIAKQLRSGRCDGARFWTADDLTWPLYAIHRATSCDRHCPVAPSWRLLRRLKMRAPPVACGAPRSTAELNNGWINGRS